jgi:hypothetical protein
MHKIYNKIKFIQQNHIYYIKTEILTYISALIENCQGDSV